jgi:N-methylhydantoinase B
LGSFANGQVPVDFHAIEGISQPVTAKGPTVLVGADGVWEWTGANAAGFGDPLTRDPAAVATDVAHGALADADAERVYGVILSDDTDGFDAVATEERRRHRLAARLASAVLPAGVERLDPDAIVRPLAGELAVARLADGTEVFATLPGRAVLGPTNDDPKAGCAIIDQLVREFAPEYATEETRAGWSVRYREYLCPVTGYRIDSEIIREGDEPTRGMSLASRIVKTEG